MSQKQWSDIGYIFLVGGDGAAYEGCGLTVMGANTSRYNNLSIGIAFVGNFQQNKPPEYQILAAQKLLQFGYENGKLDKNYKLSGHKQLGPTDSPGEELFLEISKWDYFDSEFVWC